MNIIVAVDSAGGFAKEGKIPWHYKCDFKHFKDVTDGHVCVMGRNTYLDMVRIMDERGKDYTDSILSNRKCYVVSSTLNQDDVKGATVIRDLNDAVYDNADREIFVLGGEMLFLQALSQVSTVHMTVIDRVYKCDKFFPVQCLSKFSISEGRTETEDETNLMFVTYRR